MPLVPTTLMIRRLQNRQARNRKYEIADEYPTCNPWNSRLKMWNEIVSVSLPGPPLVSAKTRS